MTEELTVYCPKEDGQVPVWYCMGSFFKGKEFCSHLIKITVSYRDMKAERVCELDE